MYYVTIIGLSHHMSVVMCFVYIIIIIIIIIIIAVPTYSSMHHYESVALRNDISLHTSAERPILCQISSLMYPKIQEYGSS